MLLCYCVAPLVCSFFLLFLFLSNGLSEVKLLRDRERRKALREQQKKALSASRTRFCLVVAVWVVSAKLCQAEGFISNHGSVLHDAETLLARSGRYGNPQQESHGCERVTLVNHVLCTFFPLEDVGYSSWRNCLFYYREGLSKSGCCLAQGKF